MKKKTEKKKSNLEELYEEMLKENDENDPMMKHLKRQIEEARERIKLLEEEIEKTNFLNRILDETYTVGDITYDRRSGRPIDPPKTGFETPPISDKTPLLDELNKEREFLDNALKMGTAKAKLEERIRDLMKEQNGLSE